MWLLAPDAPERRIGSTESRGGRRMRRARINRFGDRAAPEGRDAMRRQDKSLIQLSHTAGDRSPRAASPPGSPPEMIHDVPSQHSHGGVTVRSVWTSWRLARSLILHD